jgi:hypothetical protein
MRILTSFIFAVGLGLLGAIAWIFLAKAMERELIGMGLVVAVLTGLGARRGARGRVGVLSGLMAVVAMFLTFGIGLAAPASGDRLERLGRVDRQFQSALPPYSRDVLMAYLAQGVADEWEAQGRTLDWPPRSTSAMLGAQRSQFPPRAWDEAVARFESLDPAGQREVDRLWAQEHARREREHQQGWQEIRAQTDPAGRRASPPVRQAVSIAALLVAALVGGVRTGPRE